MKRCEGGNNDPSQTLLQQNKTEFIRIFWKTFWISTDSLSPPTLIETGTFNTQISFVITAYSDV